MLGDEGWTLLSHIYGGLRQMSPRGTESFRAISKVAFDNWGWDPSYQGNQTDLSFHLVLACFAHGGMRRDTFVFLMLTGKIWGAFVRQGLAFNFKDLPRQRIGRRMSSSSRDEVEGLPSVVCDSHLHVWSDGKEPFPYAAGNPMFIVPTELQSVGSVENLIVNMDRAGIQKALIIQPINHLFDHSYVTQALKKHPSRFKGMLNANPNLSPDDAVDYVKNLKKQGFCSIRFNPYIWPEGQKFNNAVGRAYYSEAGALGMPIGFMLFKGLPLHIQEVTDLLESYPSTVAIIDHFGFFRQGGQDDEAAWQQLLSLARFPQLHVKVSGFFRVSGESWPFPGLKKRVQDLVRVYGPKRLMWGSDFPYVTTMGGGYYEAPKALLSWGDIEGLDKEGIDQLYAGTFQNIFPES